MSVSNIYSTNIPFPNINTYLHALQFLGVAGVAIIARVCSTWNRSLANQEIWKELFAVEGIPCVTSAPGTSRDYREDLKILYPRTISSRIIGQFLGTVPGPVPNISEKQFNLLREPDGFEAGKTKIDTFVFVVVPSSFIRFLNENEFNQQTSLATHVHSSNEKEVYIPFSLRNFKRLCESPLSGRENMPVFNKNSWEEVFDNADVPPSKNEIYLMRKSVVNQSRNLPLDQQHSLLQARRFEVTPFKVRMLYNSINILKHGSCADCFASRSYARTSDVVNKDGEVYCIGIGGFKPCEGVGVSGSPAFINSPGIGVVPGCFVGISKDPDSMECSP